jgi:hypothetical protein
MSPDAVNNALDASHSIWLKAAADGNGAEGGGANAQLHSLVSKIRRCRPFFLRTQKIPMLAFKLPAARTQRIMPQAASLCRKSG